MAPSNMEGVTTSILVVTRPSGSVSTNVTFTTQSHRMSLTPTGGGDAQQQFKIYEINGPKFKPNPIGNKGPFKSLPAHHQIHGKHKGKTKRW